MAQAIRSRLGPLVSKTRATVEPAYKWTENMTTKHYEQLMKENQKYVVKDKEAADKLLKQYVFTKLHSIPDALKQNTKEYGQLTSKLSGVQHLHLREVGTYALFAAEVYAWFCVGEIVGRGFTLSGYDI